MLKAIITTDSTIAANTNIPLSIVKNTSGDVVYDPEKKLITFLKAGIYKVDFHIVTTDVAQGDITVFEVLNNVQSDIIFSSGTSTGTTEFITLDVPDIISIYPSSIGNNATLSYQSDVACTGTSGILSIIKLGR